MSLGNTVVPLFMEDNNMNNEAELSEKRKEVADRALVAAVKIVVELRRA
jgi:hypothetical protein